MTIKVESQLECVKKLALKIIFLHKESSIYLFVGFPKEKRNFVMEDEHDTEIFHSLRHMICNVLEISF